VLPGEDRPPFASFLEAWKVSGEGVQSPLPNHLDDQPFSMKKVMPYLCNLYNRWSNKRLIRLLALLLALAVPAPVLLGGDDDHDRNNDREHGRFVDPIVGSWIIHIQVTSFTFTDPTATPPPLPLVFDNMTAFWEDGNTTSSDPTQGTSYGVWKKVGPRMYLTKIVQVNSDTTLGTVFGGMPLPIVLNPQGDQMTGPFQGMTTDSTGKTVLARFSGDVRVDRITFDSTP
jgi:hypothetical protein